MATVKFFLKRPTEKTSSLICSLVDGRRYRIKLYPGITVTTRHWSKRNGNVLSADPRAAHLNKFLAEFVNKVSAIYHEAKMAGILPDKDHFTNGLTPKKPDSSRFWDVWDLYLTSKTGVFKKPSFQKFDSLKRHLQEFERTDKRLLDLENITEALLEDFQSFMYTKQDLNTQSTQKYVGIFKMFLNWCVKRKHTANADFRNFTPIRQPDSLKVIMTKSDLEAIRSVDLKDKDYLKNTRSLFLLACSTGLRYSDFSRVKSQHLKKDGSGYLLEIRQTKTEDYVSIPLNPEALGIVRDLIEGRVHPISNQKMNNYVKELCRMAGVDEDFEVTKYKGKDKTLHIQPKYELVTTHTGRRTFATNLLNNGVPAEVVMQFTGHRDYKSFSKYVNIPKKAQMQIVRSAMEKMRVA
jgi:site-specific recombinase XerD